MKGKYLAGFVAVVGAQLLLLLGMIGFNEYSLQTGAGVVLQTVPIDPRSLLQGDYVVLGYKIDTVPPYLGTLPQGAPVYVTLVEGPEVWEAEFYSVEPPPSGRVFIKGAVGSNRRLDFGIGNYFVPEGKGRIIEQAMFSGDPMAVKVRVKVDANGKAVIQELLVHGKPFDPKMPEPPVPTPPERTAPPQPTPPDPPR